MISNERKEELQFLIRNGVPIRMTDEVQDINHIHKIPYTDIEVDYSDLYTLRDLAEAGIVEFNGLDTSPDGEQSVSTTFYEAMKICNDEGNTMSITAMETINIAVEGKIIEDIRNLIGN